MLFHRKSCFLCREQSRGTGFIAFIKIIAAGDAPLGQRQGGVFRVPPPCLWTPPTPQRERGCSPLVTPKLLGSIQKIQAAALEDFLCSADLKSLARRNVRATACFYADMNAPAGSQRQHMPFAVTAFPVKMRLERSAERSKRKYKIIFPLNMPRATRRAF